MTQDTGAADYLARHFGKRSAAPVFITTLGNDRHAKITPRQLISREREAIEWFVARSDLPERACYFCVSTVQPGAHRRAKDTLAQLVGLHVDLDFKSIDASPAEVEQVLAELPLLPNRVNHSGHGLHAYWLFNKALAATPESVARLEDALKLLAKVLAGDPRCARRRA